jgi:hypothetical protein
MAALDRVQHFEEGVELFITQYKAKPRLAALLRSWLIEAQVLEDTFLEIIEARSLDTAVGAQLDTLGKIVGEFRNDRTDELYRTYIRARIRANLSFGTPDDVLEVLQIIGVEDAPELEENQASFTVSLASSDSSFGELDVEAVVNLVRRTKPTGVRFGVVVPPPGVDSESTFAFSHVGSSDGDRGFGHQGSSSYGGVFASHYE